MASPLSPQQFGELHSKLLGGGFSVNVRTGQEPSSGWFVSRQGSEGRFNLPGGPENLQSHYAAHQPQIERAGHFGGWGSGGEGVLDASRRYPSTTKGFMGAARSMKAQKQESIYNVDADRYYTNQARSGKSVAEFADTPEHAENQITHQQFAKARLREMGHDV